MPAVMEKMVRFLTETSYDDLPADARDYAKRLCLSQLGAVIGGVAMPVSMIVAKQARHCGGVAEGGVAGHGFKAPVAEAALCNAVFAHATELEDDALIPPDRTTIGTIIPAMFTLGEALHSSGRELIEAIIVGFDVQTKTAVAARSPNTRGSMAFTTGGWGTAASAAKLMKLDAGRTRMTMSIAASQVGGLLHQVPTMMHFLESGMAARDGILAAHWARDGITGSPGIIEVHDGFWDMMRADREGLDVLDGLLDGDIQLMRVGIKKYGCAYLMQRIIDGALELRDTHSIAYDQIESVELHVAPWFEEFLRRNPATVDEARFSASHVLAGIFLGEPVDLHTFSDEAIRDPRYRDAETKVTLITDEARGHARFDRPDELVIRLKDGSEHRKMCDIAKGSPPQYLDEDEVMGKFAACARYSEYLSEDTIARVGELVLNLDTVKDVTEITDLLTFGDAPAAALRAV